MGKFKRLSLEEAAIEFPLINEEARRALKGGCDKCDVWMGWGFTPVSEDEYYKLENAGKWKGGLVCGMGYVLRTAIATPDGSIDNYNTIWETDGGYIVCGVHSSYFKFGEQCDGCYFGHFNFCRDHQSYFTGYCSNCGEGGNSGGSGGVGGGGGGGSAGSGGGESSGEVVTPEPPKPVEPPQPPEVTLPDVDLTNKEYFVGYGDSKDCLKGCKAIMNKYGLGEGEYGSSAHVYQLLTENNGVLEYYADDYKTVYANAVSCIDRHIDAGRPIIVGVNHTLDKEINEGATDHWVLVTGRGYDEERDMYYYIYMETGSGNSTEGCDTTNNRLYYDSENYTFIDDSDRNKRRLDVTQVRPNDGQNLGETTVQPPRK